MFSGAIIWLGRECISPGRDRSKQRPENQQHRNVRSDAIEGIMLVVGCLRVQKILRWRQSLGEYSRDVDPALFVNCRYQIERCKAKSKGYPCGAVSERREGTLSQRCKH